VKESIILGRFDVVFITGQGFCLTPGRTARTVEVEMEVLTSLRKTKNASVPLEWFTEGIECEVMTSTSNGWLGGKVRLSLEFILDPEPEQEAELVEEIQPEENVALKQPSPLDEFRQTNIE
jgi:hypothetical protein